MALEFRPPQDLINAYLNRPSPGQEASQAIGSALENYAKAKAMHGQHQNEALKAYIEAFGAGGPALAGDVAKRMGLDNPPVLPGSQPPVTSTATVPSPMASPVAVTPVEEAAQQSLPSEHPAGVPDTTQGISPLVRASLAAGHPNHAGLTLPSQDDPVTLANMGAYGTKKLAALEGVQKLTDAQRKRASEEDDNSPVSFDYAKAKAEASDAPNAADPFIKIAKAEGRDKLSRKEMSDLKDAITARASSLRGSAFDKTANVREQTMRDSLIKEARTTLDPYFSTGAGKQQAVRLQSIGRAEALASQMLTQVGGGDTRQIRELATSLGSVLAGGNVVAQNQIEELIPQTYKGKFNAFMEKLSNNPTGTEQQAFIKRLSETLAREKSTIQKQSRSVAERTAPTLRVLKSQYPEDYNAIVDQYMNHSPEIMGQAPTPVAAPKIGTIEDGHRFLGGNPADPHSWEAE